VGVNRQRPAWKIPLRSATKFVLIALADHACDACGLAWPGVPHLIEKTGLADRTIRGALDELLAAGTIRLHGYGTGGRGRATEYVVLPGLDGTEQAPCHRCCAVRKTPQEMRGIEGRNPAAGAGFKSQGNVIPCSSRRLNPAAGAAQPSVEPEPPRAHAREADPTATEKKSPRGAATPPTWDSPPATAKDAQERVLEVDRWLRTHTSRDIPRTAKHEAQEQLPDRDTAQESSHPKQEPPGPDDPGG
jgi:hypothetical protein